MTLSFLSLFFFLKYKMFAISGGYVGNYLGAMVASKYTPRSHKIESLTGRPNSGLSHVSYQIN